MCLMWFTDLRVSELGLGNLGPQLFVVFGFGGVVFVKVELF